MMCSTLLIWNKDLPHKLFDAYQLLLYLAYLVQLLSPLSAIARSIIVGTIKGTLFALEVL